MFYTKLRNMKTLFASCLILLASVCGASAWKRGSVSDEKSVSRAQLIVVGHLKKDSLKLRQTPIGKMSDASADAVLVVSEVLKGPFEVAEVPVRIAYGLTPVVGDDDKRQGPGASLSPKAGEVKLYDSGNSVVSIQPVTGDLNQDQIWLLRIEAGDENRRLGEASRTLRVWDPEDVQPLTKKEALVALLNTHVSTPSDRKEKIEQGGAEKPSTFSESDQKGGDQSHPESEQRSR